MATNSASDSAAAINANPADSTLFLGHNGDWWDWALLIALVLTSFVAVAVFTATAGQIISHKRESAAEKDEFAKYKLATEVRIAEADAKGKMATEHAAKLSVELEQAKNAAKQIDTNLLREQRLTALERWRLRRVERAVLPRSIFIDWSTLSSEIKKIGLGKIYIVVVDDSDMELSNFWINLTQCFQNANVKVFMQTISPSDFRFLPNTSTGVGIVTFDEKGAALAKMLWQKFRLGGGTMGVFPQIRPDIPRDANWLVVGRNNWAMAPPDGQDGEGIDEQGRPVPPL